MKKLFLLFITLTVVIFPFSSCANAQVYGSQEEIHQFNNDVVVVNGVCYVYYSNPTTLFLNSLHITNGAYYYYHRGSYIPVIFPNWEVWSPHRFFYYNVDQWCWRDRYVYNHNEYRRKQCWIDHRRRQYMTNTERRPIMRQHRGQVLPNRTFPQNHNKRVGRR